MNKIIQNIALKDSPFYLNYGYKGYIVISEAFKSTTGEIRRKFSTDYFNNESSIYIHYSCLCGNNNTITIKEARTQFGFYGSSYDDKINKFLKNFYCTSCKNTNFLAYPKNYELVRYKVEETERTIKIYKIKTFIGIGRTFKPYIKSSNTLGFFISKINGSIQKAYLNSSKVVFQYVAINETNDFLQDYVLPILLKTKYQEFEILHLYGTNFSIFCGKNAIKTQEDLAKRLFKNTYTKSVKREFFQNMNNKNLLENENYILTYRAIGKYFKNTNNVLKVLKSNYFLEVFGQYTRDMAGEAYNYDINTSDFVEIFFYVGIKIYGETKFSTYISKLNYENTNNANMYLRDFAFGAFRLTKKNISRAIAAKNNPKIKKPLDIFKGLHDFGILYKDILAAEEVISYKDCYNSKIKNKIKKLNDISLNVNVHFELPSDSRELKIYEFELNNCISDYGYNILKRNLIIIGIYYKNKIFAAAELRDDGIYQLRAKNNTLLHESDYKLLSEYLFLVNIKILRQ